MPGNIRIIEATESDLPAIVALLSELVDTVDNREGLDTAVVTENVSTLLHSPACYLLVAKDGSDVVGCISFAVRRTALHDGLSGLIDEMVVLRSSRGSGVGRQLVQAAVETCRHLGCIELEVSTEKTNRAARRFYRQCGFKEDAVQLEMQL